MLSKIIDKDCMLKITSEFKRLGDKCYLDHAGAALYPKSLIKRVNDDLLTNIYMNPHSDKHTNDCIEQIRYSVLQYFNTDPSNYTVIFTSGATQALRLVAETFDFGDDANSHSKRGSFVYLRDNHTSVLGLRELVKERNADVINISKDEFLQTLESFEIPTCIISEYKYKTNSLLAYPAQSSFNGYKYPVDCMDRIKYGCLNKYTKCDKYRTKNMWYILLDAASFVSTNKMNLSENQPDFISLSFYKLFGFPTGLGALLVKNDRGNVLSEKKYFGGGAVDVVLASEDYHVKRAVLHERFEDGTIPFLSILALKHCFDVQFKMIPKVIKNSVMETISYHTFFLAKDLYEQLNSLHHENGRKAATLYMDTEFEHIEKQGGMVTFNLLRADGSYIGYAEFQHMAELFNIYVRTGCFCNSGSCQRHLNLSNEDIKNMYKAGHKCGNDVDLINGKPTGCVRVSFGYYNTFDDVDRLVSMICRCFLKTNIKTPLREMTTFNVIKDSYQNKGKTDTIANGNGYLKNNHIPVMCNEFNKDTEIFLKGMAIFPIKSCGAYKIPSMWKIGSKGFEFDREWMIVKDNGVCLTQKQNTLMCMIRPSFDFEEKRLKLDYPGKETISIPLYISNCNTYKHTSLCQTKVCTDVVQGYDCGDEIGDWISEALEISFLRLIRQSEESSRTKMADENKNIKLSLTNQAQFLLINTATVQWLHDKIKDETFSDNIEHLTDRFRANIIVNANKELIEREWEKVIIGKHEFKVEGLCSRCHMVCIDQQTGQKTIEPLRTISEQFCGKIKFGIYLSYIGTTNECNDAVLKINSPVRPIITDNII